MEIVDEVFGCYVFSQKILNNKLIINLVLRDNLCFMSFELRLIVYVNVLVRSIANSLFEET